MNIDQAREVVRSWVIYMENPEAAYPGDIDILLDAASALLDALTWKPIEDAPRDGTRLILARPNRLFPVVVGAYCEDTEMWWDDNGDDIEPTHYLPIPPSPQGGE